MAHPSPKSVISWVLGLLMALAGCGGGTDARESSVSESGKVIASEHAGSSVGPRFPKLRFGHGAQQSLLIGTANRTIVQVELRSGQVMATLSVPTPPWYIAADETNIYFGGWLARFDLATQEIVNFTYNDAYTIVAGMAIAPGGTLFASNLYHWPGTVCAACSTVVAYPDPNGNNAASRSTYPFGRVRSVPGAEGVLSGQQLDFTDDARLLVTSKAGDGIFVSDAPVVEACCGPNPINFLPLVVDPDNTVLRFARSGDRHLLVLHSTGQLDEHDLATGRLIRPILQAGTVDPIDFVVSQDGTVYVLEKPGRIRVFSDRGRERSTLALPAGTGQALSLALCCGAARQHGRGHH